MQTELPDNNTGKLGHSQPKTKQDYIYFIIILTYTITFLAQRFYKYLIFRPINLIWYKQMLLIKLL